MNQDNDCLYYKDGFCINKRHHSLWMRIKVAFGVAKCYHYPIFGVNYRLCDSIHKNEYHSINKLVKDVYGPAIKKYIAFNEKYQKIVKLSNKIAADNKDKKHYIFPACANYKKYKGIKKPTCGCIPCKMKYEMVQRNKGK